MNDKEDRIVKLSQRFKTHVAGRPKNTNKNRERQSFYLDADLTERIDKTYKDINHQLYPKSISNSMFLETVLEFGLENLESIKSRLSEVEEITEKS